MAYASTKMESVRNASTSSVMLKSFLMEPKAGAIIDEEIGDTSVKADTMNVAAHFRFMDQFFGFFGSAGESQVTCTY